MVDIQYFMDVTYSIENLIKGQQKGSNATQFYPKYLFDDSRSFILL